MQPHDLSPDEIDGYEIKYLQLIKDILVKHIPLNDYSLFLFGSRAVRNHRRRSDVDIGVWGNTPLSPIIKFKIEDEINESIVPYKVDIIDFSEVDDNFKKFAFEKINVWNQAINFPLLSKALQNP